MMKLVGICLLVTSLSSCISFYDSAYRDADRCTYTMIDPSSKDPGSLRKAIEANEENWKVNKPDCDRIFEDLGL